MLKAQSRSSVPILDFDIENRPLSYWYDGQCTADVTAIAWSWVGSDEVECYWLNEEEDSGLEMLEAFREAYDQAVMVTGHYIRKHDLPILNGAFMEHGIEPLDEKLTSDTKLDLVRINSLSASQESLSAMFGLSDPKYHMTQQQWRTANRLTDAGIAQTRKRVMDDVVQHKTLRRHLIKEGLLRGPKVWRP